MSKFSSQTQAVLQAACIHHGLFNEEVLQRRRMLAAALRAAADQGEIFFDAYDSPVQVVTVEDLLAIANELEAQ